MEDSPLVNNEVIPFRWDRKDLIDELVKRMPNIDTRSAGIRDAILHCLTCPHFDDDLPIVYTVQELAVMLDVGTQTLYDHMDAGLLPYSTKGVKLILPQQLKVYLLRLNKSLPDNLLQLVGKFVTELQGFLTPSEAVEKYSVSRDKLYRWLRNYQIKFIFVGVRKYLILEKSLRRKIQFDLPTVTQFEVDDAAENA